MNTIKPTPVKVQWNISADIECPHCEHINNFMDVDEWWCYSQVGETKDKFFAPVIFGCDDCHKEFIINGSEY